MVANTDIPGSWTKLSHMNSGDSMETYLLFLAIIFIHLHFHENLHTHTFLLFLFCFSHSPQVYVDYTGAGVYQEKQISEDRDDLISNMYGNAHSRSKSALHTEEVVEVFEFFSKPIIIIIIQIKLESQKTNIETLSHFIKRLSRNFHFWSNWSS